MFWQILVGVAVVLIVALFVLREPISQFKK